MPALLDSGPSTAFDDVEPEYLDLTTEATYADEPAPSRRRPLTRFTVAWVRSMIAHLEVSNAPASLKREVLAVLQDFPQLAEFSEVLCKMLEEPSSVRALDLVELARVIQSAPVPSFYIQEALRQCTTRGRGFGLDIGVDLLSLVGPLILPFASDFLRRDRTRWSQTPTIAQHEKDDYWYVLLGALARSGLAEDDFYGLIEACGQAGQRSLRDAAVLALYELASPRARARVEAFAQQDSDSFIRDSARELLEDLEN
jgi:hypothetical protein